MRKATSAAPYYPSCHWKPYPETNPMSRAENSVVDETTELTVGAGRRHCKQEGMKPVCFDGQCRQRSARPAAPAPGCPTAISRMPGTSCLKCWRVFVSNFPKLLVIIMTAHSDPRQRGGLYQGGAFEYPPKPFDWMKPWRWFAARCGTAANRWQEPDCAARHPKSIAKQTRHVRSLRAIAASQHSNINR